MGPARGPGPHRMGGQLTQEGSSPAVDPPASCTGVGPDGRSGGGRRRAAPLCDASTGCERVRRGADAGDMLLAARSKIASIIMPSATTTVRCTTTARPRKRTSARVSTFMAA